MDRHGRVSLWPWRRAALCAPICAIFAACSTLAPAPESAPSPGAPAARPKTDAPAENASPAEAIGTKPAEQPPGDQNPAPMPAPPSSSAPAEKEPKEPAPAQPGAGDGKPSATTGSPEQSPAEQSPKSEPGEPAPPAADDNILEQTRRSVHSTAVWLARGVDSWFGDKPFEQGGKVTDGRLSLGLLKRQGESLDVKVRFNGRFRLPNVEERTYFFFGRDNDRETVADTPGALSRQDRLLAEGPDDRTFFAGFGYALREAFDLRIGFHGIKPYGQARYRDTWNLTQRDLIEFRQTFFWRISDHFGSTTALSYEHAYSSTLALRWLSATTRTQKSRQFDWSSIIGLYKGFAGERLLSLEYVVSGSQHTGFLVSEHGAQTKWSQPIYRDWLFLESIAGLYWPRRALDESRQRRWAFGTSLTMRF
jgi:hypothetical protein